MPKLTYTPEGVEPMSWDLEFGQILSPERIAIERATGMPWRECCQRFFKDDTAVLDAFLHVLMKRSRPTLKLPTHDRAGDVLWCGDEVETDLTDKEALDFVTHADATKDPDLIEAADELRPRVAHLLEADASDPVDEG